MKKGPSRPVRVADLIQTALADILQRTVDCKPFGLVTITTVSLSPDLSYAKIYVSVLNEEKAKEAVLTLNAASKSIRYELAHAVKLRITPAIKFYYDDSSIRGHRISSLINDALKNKE